MSETSIKPLRGLIVDDSNFDRKILSLILGSHPEFTVAGMAADGEEGLKLAKELMPDFLTVDFDMPKLNGYEMLERIREFCDAPAILCSGLPVQNDAYTEAIGIYDSIVKSFSNSQIDFTLFDEELKAKILAAVEWRKRKKINA